MPYLLILLALAAVWLDVAVAGWWPVALYPFWLWVGTTVLIFRKNTTGRWLWLLAISAWTLFVVPWPNVLYQFLIFAVWGELFNYIFYRFIPAKQSWLPILSSGVVLIPCLALVFWATSQTLAWMLLWKAATTTFVIWLYESLKKNRRTSQYI